MTTKVQKLKSKLWEYLDDIFYTYGQYVDGTVYGRCRLYSALISIMDIWDYDIGLDGIREFIAYATNELKIPNEWGQIKTGAMIVSNRRNKKYPNMKVSYIMSTIWSVEYSGAFRRGKPIVHQIYISDKYVEDRKDLKLDYSNYHNSTLATKDSNGRPIPIKYRPFGRVVPLHAITIKMSATLWVIAMDSASHGLPYSIPWGMNWIVSTPWFIVSKDVSIWSKA